jgi:hypothetical protein
VGSAPVAVGSLSGRSLLALVTLPGGLLLGKLPYNYITRV